MILSLIKVLLPAFDIELISRKYFYFTDQMKYLFLSESFVDDGDDTMESVLSWKLTEISQANAGVSSAYSGPGNVVVNGSSK